MGVQYFTETHRIIYDDLLLLATNHYSEVRIKGQDILGKAVKHFSHSYQLLTPKLIRLLQKFSIVHASVKAIGTQAETLGIGLHRLLWLFPQP